MSWLAWARTNRSRMLLWTLCAVIAIPVAALWASLIGWLMVWPR